MIRRSLKLKVLHDDSENIHQYFVHHEDITLPTFKSYSDTQHNAIYTQLLHVLMLRAQLFHVLTMFGAMSVLKVLTYCNRVAINRFRVD